MTFCSSFGMGSNLTLQCLQKYVIAKVGETRGLRTALLSTSMHMPFIIE